MNRRHSVLNTLKSISAALALGLSIGACVSVPVYGGTSWKEEVLLHDGSKIIVTRSVSRGGRHEIGQQPPIKEQSVLLTLPITSERVTWKSEFSEDVGLADFQPLLLDIFQGTVYVVTHPVGCLAYNKWGRPNPPYVVFKYQDKAWHRITLQELPKEIKTPNMIFGSPDNHVKGLGTKFVKVEEVQKINSSLKQPEYRSIGRESIPNAGGSRCGEMIGNGKGRWEGIGWFKKQPSLEACLQYCERKDFGAQYCPCNRLFEGR